jgi:hypothetical protein
VAVSAAGSTRRTRPLPSSSTARSPTDASSAGGPARGSARGGGGGGPGRAAPFARVALPSAGTDPTRSYGHRHRADPPHAISVALAASAGTRGPRHISRRLNQTSRRPYTEPTELDLGAGGFPGVPARGPGRTAQLVDPELEFHRTVGGVQEGQVAQAQVPDRPDVRTEDLAAREERRLEAEEFIDAGDSRRRRFTPVSTPTTTACSATVRRAAGTRDSTGRTGSLTRTPAPAHD